MGKDFSSALRPAIVMTILVAILLGLIGAIWLRRTTRKVGRIGIAVGLPLLVAALAAPLLGGVERRAHAA